MLGVLRVEHPYIFRKSEKFLDMHGRAHLLFRENCMLPTAAANQSACFSFSLANYSRKLHKKALNKRTKSGNFTEHYIIRLLSVHELVLLGRRLVLKYNYAYMAIQNGWYGNHLIVYLCMHVTKDRKDNMTTNKSDAFSIHMISTWVHLTAKA